MKINPIKSGFPTFLKEKKKPEVKTETPEEIAAAKLKKEQEERQAEWNFLINKEQKFKEVKDEQK